MVSCKRMSILDTNQLDYYMHLKILRTYEVYKFYEMYMHSCV